MASVTLTLPEEVKQDLDKLPWVNWSELAKEEFIKKTLQEIMLKKLNSKEEKEFIKWSVELGRKAKKGRFKKLLAELSPEKRRELLKE
ncbi:MAG: hypothetical protein AABX29_01505 [Nanoarchaeota archaeon]